MNAYGLCDLRAHCLHRIQRSHRALENEGKLAPSHSIDFSLGQREKIASLKFDGPLSDFSGGW
jgi:hypothetical protein